MATGVKGGFNPSRTRGSGPDCQSLETFGIANEYATTLYYGAPVKLGTSGTIELAANGDTVIGVFMGTEYTDADGQLSQRKYWPASTDSATTPKALVDSRANKTYSIKANGPVTNVRPGQKLDLEKLGEGSTLTGRASEVANVLATEIGDTDISGVTDLGASTAVTDTDAFTVKSASETGAATTITIDDGDGTTELLAKINAVANVSAELTSGGFLKIQATDNESLVLADTVGTPLVDLGLSTGTQTIEADTPTIIVEKVIDAADRHLEVSFGKHEYRDNIA